MAPKNAHSAVDVERPTYRAPTEAELQERHLEALEIVADWKDSIARRRKRLELRAELIGGIDDDEVGELRQDSDRLARCIQVLKWGME
jgi:hypothetical protein